MAVKAPSDPTPTVALQRTTSMIASARRAAVADRYAVERFTVEWRPLSELESIANEWRELAARALQPNVFYEPAFALAAAAPFGSGVGVALVWSGTQPRKLLGFFPARVQKRRYGLKLPVLVGWTHPYAPLGTPLVEPDAAEPVIAAWLDYLAGDPAMPGILLLPLLPAEGAFAAALSTILRRAQVPCVELRRHRRARLMPTADRAHYLERSLSGHKLKELRRIGRRLSDVGALLFASDKELPAIASALDDFLAVEAGGWKGRAGTAAALNPKIKQFVQAALHGLAADGKVWVNRILLDGCVIAAAIALRSGNAAWFWKIAFDEQFARYSPGLMQTLVLTEELLDEPEIVQVDSCASSNHPMIDRVWRERLVLHDLMIALRPPAPLKRAQRLEVWRSALHHAGAWLYRRLRRR